MACDSDRAGLWQVARVLQDPDPGLAFIGRAVPVTALAAELITQAGG
jgi:hypothetical protein